MREKEIPVPLQNRILLQSGLALLTVIIGLGFAFSLKSPSAAAPCMLAAMLLTCDTIHLRHIAVKGHFVVLKGTVLNVERTIWRRRPKALLLEVDGTVLRVVLRNWLSKMTIGDMVVICISDTTPLCIWFGVKQLMSYLTLTQMQNQNFRNL